MKTETQKQLSILTDVYDRLVETQQLLDEANRQIESDFAEPDDKAKFFINPIGYKVAVRGVIEDARTSFTDFVVDQCGDDYKNLHIDRDEMKQYTKEHGFDVGTLIKTISERYADEDEVTLQQIKTTLKDLLPWRNGGQVKTPDDLTKIKDTGFELRIYGCKSEQKDKAATFLKLVDVVLRGIKPSKVDTKVVEIGKVYKDDRVKSLRYFKNNVLKVIFHTADDCEKVKVALFVDSPEI